MASGRHLDLVTVSPTVQAPILIAAFQLRDDVLVLGCSGCAVCHLLSNGSEKHKDLPTTTAKGTKC